MTRAAMLPPIIQGGMGVAVSDWRLARAVAATGQLGVVSGTALDAVLARRLQNGDVGGHMRRALAAFPFPEIAAELLDTYFLPEGRAGRPYRPIPKTTLDRNPKHERLSVAANFVEVWLAKEDGGAVGINFLTKLQMATPPAMYGAMLAGADAVLMGAGIPREIPRLMDDFAAGRAGGVSVDAIVPEGTPTPRLVFDPEETLGAAPRLPRPAFLAIVTSETLAGYLARTDDTRPDGFVVEHHSAGGHNAPPRRMQDTDTGYGPLDEANLAKMAAVGLPFWLAGSRATAEGLRDAQSHGARGIQVGSLFALSRDSGLRDELREQMLDHARAGQLHVRTDHRASPTGFPFKVVEVAGTIGSRATYEARPRLCDLSYLRTPVIDAEGRTRYICASEPEHKYLDKGGDPADLTDRLCLCNGLMAAVGLGQERPDGYVEAPLLTLGSSGTGVAEMLERFPDGWSAAELVATLLGEEPATR